jgi:hypothetical protein
LVSDNGCTLTYIAQTCQAGVCADNGANYNVNAPDGKVCAGGKCANGVCVPTATPCLTGGQGPPSYFFGTVACCAGYLPEVPTTELTPTNKTPQGTCQPCTGNGKPPNVSNAIADPLAKKTIKIITPGTTYGFSNSASCTQYANGTFPNDIGGQNFCGSFMPITVGTPIAFIINIPVYNQTGKGISSWITAKVASYDKPTGYILTLDSGQNVTAFENIIHSSINNPNAFFDATAGTTPLVVAYKNDDGKIHYYQTGDFSEIRPNGMTNFYTRCLDDYPIPSLNQTISA